MPWLCCAPLWRTIGLPSQPCGAASSKYRENAGESLQKGARVIVTGRLEQRSWENQEGERRSKIEVIADEIGPSLRWATAKVEKNERRGPSDFGGGGGGGGGASRPLPNEPEGGSHEFGDEPF